MKNIKRCPYCNRKYDGPLYDGAPLTPNKVCDECLLAVIAMKGRNK